MGKQPYFKFYPDDYIGGTMGFTIEQHGAYLLCLIYQHKNGHFSEQTADGITSGNFFLVKDKFSTDDAGLFYNQRMEYETARQIEYSESRAKNRANRKIAKICQSCDKHMLNICQSYVNHMSNICESYVKHMGHGHGHKNLIPNSNTEDNTSTGVVSKIPTAAEVCEAQSSGLSVTVAQFINAGPKQWAIQKNRVLRHFLAAKNRGATDDGLITSAASYASAIARSGRLCKDVCGWLDSDMWRDDWSLVESTPTGRGTSGVDMSVEPGSWRDRARKANEQARKERYAEREANQ